MRVAPRAPAPRRAAAALCLLLVGCGRQFSTASPAGPQARRIDDLTWLFTWLGAAVYVVVIGFLLYAVWRGHRRAENAAGPEVERRMRNWVVGAVGATLVILVFLLFANLTTGRAMGHFTGPDALTIRVTGHQWWWEVEYEDPVPARRVVTANEIHVPVGRRVRLQVRSADVIHSFWAPNLQGKLDLIPGYLGTTYFEADRPGVYHGRCAEFCGLQHAHMDFLVVAETPAKFRAWYEAQLHPGSVPTGTIEQKGQQVFLTRACSSCHTIRGTPAGGTVGPDLTHVGSRMSLAAVTLANTRGHLAGWVLDPQRIKPGAKMPPNPLAPDELQALLSYLESLK
ncbi:MAG TPA: cytochrome c oxidase subunit II [Longimicrobiaceae bacterium]|nr:cytochrome c oxidase subunit II [Longimicrobiaceae bacterium]